MVDTARKNRRDYEVLHTLLRNNARRQIIETIGQEGRAGFKDLKTKMNIGVGTLYYHLDMLSDYLGQDAEKKYFLNDRGKLLYKALQSESLVSAQMKGGGPFASLSRWTLLSPLFIKAANSRGMISAAILVALSGSVGSYAARLEPLILFFNPSTQPLLAALLFPLDIATVFGLSDALVSAVYGRRGEHLALATCIGIAMLPMAIFPFLYLGTPIAVSRAAFLILQAWFLILLSSSISVAKGLRLDRSFTVSLAILYINIAALLALGLL
jgi:hypothetical protein